MPEASATVGTRVVERIGDNRWRLVLPAPAYESLLDVIELVPAT